MLSNYSRFWGIADMAGLASGLTRSRMTPTGHRELDGHTPVLAPRLVSLLHGIGLL
jgi:hypothetical protein